MVIMILNKINLIYFTVKFSENSNPKCLFPLIFKKLKY